MESIVCDIKLGTKQQQIYIVGEKYSNKKTIESFQMPIDEIPNFIIKHNIYDIVLKGPQKFTQNIEQKVKEKELQKYSTTKINFSYIEEE